MRNVPLRVAAVLATALSNLGQGLAHADPTAPKEQITVQTDLEGARALARKALAQGNHKLTVKIAQQILRAYPNDAGANLLLAAGLTRAGHPEKAAAAARTGFHLATAKEGRFEGAYLMAEAFAASGRPWVSKYWLRRADLHAPNATAKTVLRQAYQTVSDHSPLSFGVSIFAGPSQNVNGGSLHDSFFFQGVDIPISQALSGWNYGGSAVLHYRLGKTASINLAWTHRSVVLSDKAKRLDPTAKASDFAQDELGLELSKLWATGVNQSTVYRLSGSVGKRWTAGQPSSDSLAANLSVFHAASNRLGVGGTVGVETTDYADRPNLDSQTRNLGLSLAYNAQQLGKVSFEIGLKEVDSAAAGLAWRGPTAGIAWLPPMKEFPVGLSFQANLEHRDYWMTPSFAPDLKVNISTTSKFDALETFGFSPTVTISAARTFSDVVVRDTSDFGVTFGVSSSF